MDLGRVTLGGGCFWCIEAAFRRVAGVVDAVSGYAGGTMSDPSYEMVVSGRTGHAEVVDIGYDEDEISLEGVLDVFFRIHDPTTVDRQGNDVGSQYRSIILYRNQDQRGRAEQYISELNTSGRYGMPIVTELAPLTEFYPAETYHQDYFRKNPNNTYCRLVVSPKVEKVPESRRKAV